MLKDWNELTREKMDEINSAILELCVEIKLNDSGYENCHWVIYLDDDGVIITIPTNDPQHEIASTKETNQHRIAVATITNNQQYDDMYGGYTATGIKLSKRFKRALVEA